MLASQLFRACVPSDEIRVTLSIKTFARGTSSPLPAPYPLIRPLSHRLPRSQLQKTWREKIRLQRNNELHEEGTQPGGRKLQFSEHPVPSDAPPSLPPASFPSLLRLRDKHPLRSYFLRLYDIIVSRFNNNKRRVRATQLHTTTRYVRLVAKKMTTLNLELL